MRSQSSEKSGRVVLAMCTLAFTICFAVWMLNGVLVTFLVDHRVFEWTGAQMGLLIGAPVLTGSLVRLPAGLLTDRFGGRPVFALLMIGAAVPMFLLGYADGYTSFLLCSLGFGLVGGGFSVGAAYTSVCFDKKHQGTALGIFGAGNAGAALTTMGAPPLIRAVTSGETVLDGWRTVPKIYAALLLVTAAVFYLTTYDRIAAGSKDKSVGDLLAPLKHPRVWRFGLYYFLVLGGFVALAQWLVPYYLNVYGTSLATAGLLTSVFSGPSGVTRAVGGWLSDRFGARIVILFVFAVIGVCTFLLFFPKMNIESPGRGVMATRSGIVTAVTDAEITIEDTAHPLTVRPEALERSDSDDQIHVLPVIHAWQEPLVAVGQSVSKRQIVARGVTHIYFQANVWVFTALAIIVGIAMGIGKAAVYRYIPDYFPDSVGVVGGLVGVLGGLGGFVSPVIFGYLLDGVGLWTTSWMFLFGLTAVCALCLAAAVSTKKKKKKTANSPPMGARPGSVEVA